MEYFDAHNHLQDERFAGKQEEILAAARAAGITRMVVNGSCEADWPTVRGLAGRHVEVVPSFGCHPWHLRERTPRWQDTLTGFLDQVPGAVIGEIGLDRWMLDNPERWRTCQGQDAGFTGEPPPLAEQEAVFQWQLRLAAERNLPASLHCLQAFGRLRELLEENPRPARGFLLHSYGGPVEMIPAFAKLGGYFSFSGHFLHDRKVRQRETFLSVPPERLLVETDAPDQMPPPEVGLHSIAGPDGHPLNHPANLPAIYLGLSRVLKIPLADLCAQVAANFSRLFGRPRIPEQGRPLI